MNRILTIVLNFFWFANCLPAYLRFHFASRKIREVQEKQLFSFLYKNRNTEYGRSKGFNNINSWDDFSKLSVTEYRDYNHSVKRIMEGKENILTREAVKIFQPTSGTSSAPKLIPHTESAGNEFKSALNVWISDLFMIRPKLFFGPQYWTISPSMEVCINEKSKVPVGFLDDAEYFGSWTRWIIDRILAVPSDVRHIPDIKANQYVTLLFLLRLKFLRLISVWHPSFLTILLDTARANWDMLLHDIESGGINRDLDIPEDIRKRLLKRLKPYPSRAAEMKRFDAETDDLFSMIWPDLQVISCWRDGNMDRDITELEKSFPGVLIQGKGLLATEGVVSIPLGESKDHVCAVTSHFLEFQGDDGIIHPVWDLEKGKVYRVILTTGGGLYRYQQKDLIRVAGFYKNIPSIRFIGREGGVSDCVGEKVHLEHVEKILPNILKQHDVQTGFAMLVPPGNSKNRRYNLLLEKSGKLDLNKVAASLETELCRNYHYSNARKIGQLQKAIVTAVAENAKTCFRNLMVKQGAIASTVKFPALCMVPGVEEHLKLN